MKAIIETYHKLWSVIPLYKSNFCLIILSKILATIASIFIPLAAANIVKYLTINDYQNASLWILYFFLSATLKVFFSYFNYYSAAKDSDYCYTNLKQKCYEKISTYDLEFTKTKNIDQILQATSSDIWKVTGLNDNLSDVIITFIKIILIIILVATNSIFLGILVLIFSLIYWIVTCIFNNRVIKYLHKQRKYQDKIAGILIEEMESLEEMKAYNMEDKYYQHFLQANNKFCDNYGKKRRYADLQSNFSQLILELGEIAIYLVTLFLLFKGEYTVDKIVLVIGYFSLLTTDLKYMLENCVKNMINNKISVERIYDLFQYRPKQIEFGSDRTDDIEGSLEFRHIYTSYGNKEVLHNVSFIVKPRELTAIVGRSGSGKSTILNHILRLYQPTSGMILIDSKDIFSYQEDVYKANVSVVTQKSLLFNMSIHDNLSLVDRNTSHQQEVCQSLGIEEEILALPQGYQTIIEENGANISTRLKQLLSIARCLLTKAEILLFDEITSSLDRETTLQVIKVLKKLAKTHTVILITHKKEVMDQVDHLIVINKGRKVADGTVESLQNDPYYLDLKNSKSLE